METTATVKNIRISPEKVNLLVAQIKPMSPVQAVKVLNFVNKSSSQILSKLIKSAIANAKHNQGAQDSDLAFKEIFVTKGPSYKRFQPVSRGRAHHILKRTSNITIILQDTVKKPSVVKKEQPETKKLVEDKKGGQVGTKS